MPVVSNTSPLLNLAIIDRLILVKQQFGKIVIPNEVLTELKINENLPGSQQLREAIASEWITIQQVEDRALVKLLRRDLDRGESEAIAFFDSVECGLVTIRRKRWEKYCQNFRFECYGSFGNYPERMA